MKPYSSWEKKNRSTSHQTNSIGSLPYQGHDQLKTQPQENEMTIIKGEHLKCPVENDPSTSSNRDTTRDMSGRQNRASTSILGTSKIHINFLQEKEKKIKEQRINTS